MKKIPLLLFVFSIHAHNDVEQLLESLKLPSLPNGWIERCNEQGILAGKPKKMTFVKRPLYRAFPALFAHYPSIACAKLPTPITTTQALNEALGTEVFIKRDDLTGIDENGMPLFGGNKVRKLEFLLGQAKQYNAHDVITFGCAGSNHAVATAVYAKRAGFNPICMLNPQPNSRVVRRNLLLHVKNNTELHAFENNASRSMGTLFKWLDIRLSKGVAPYLIPTGGSNPVGALGFVNAAYELKEQIQSGVLPEPDYIYVACGSAGTAAGLWLGCQLAQLKTIIIAVPVQPEQKEDQFLNQILDLGRKTYELLQKSSPALQCSLDESRLKINSSFAGERYGMYTPQGMDALKLVKKHAGVELDGTYSAKSFACLVDDARRNLLKGKTVLYWNTYCGLDFNQQLHHLSYRALPDKLHSYFDQELQPLEKLLHQKS